MYKLNSFLLESYFKEPLNRREFDYAKTIYLENLKNQTFQFPITSDILEQIKLVKRTPETIGPYVGLTVFESLNRIASDLVILAGAQNLFNEFFKSIKPKSIQLNMGNKGGHDFTVITENGLVIYGEAFNAAQSFAIPKMRQTIDKIYKNNEIHKSQQAIIFYNSELQSIIENYVNQKEISMKEKQDFRIIKMPCDYERLM